ncbi:histidine kinase [Tsukamurella sp. 8F]|uniref:MadS family sensor histidine kinase n=1 Tax=unclassified Tsukamurella TaxID=2633480 RepID=UPI0023B88C62|nr:MULTISPECIES: GAF domain-containing sensor histidine kinase [unclassified Tsukamurella]MDF0530829.1 histidine kinase [Tsukamurella sp. 8J]MDF0588226.1 histidine kinase [Tsukamurella sp. 8F]
MLTGLRSSKSSFYPQYRGAAERLERVMHALELISRALVATVDGPETLVCAVAEAARVHLDARWVVFGLTDGRLMDAGLRRLVLGPDGIPFLVHEVEGPPLPDDVLRCLDVIRDPVAAGTHEQTEPVLEAHHAFVPLELEGGVVGAIAAWTAPGRVLDTTDGAVLSILASQTAVALHNSALYQRISTLLERSEAAHAQVRRTAADLALRNAELSSTQRQLSEAQRHQALDDERHRIARELHDSVTQTVLSAGMQIEVSLGEIPAAERSERLGLAKEMTRRAVEQLRTSIYTLNNTRAEEHSSLPQMLEQLGVVYQPDELDVTVRVSGPVVELDPPVEHALLRIAGEALFNTAVHGNARRARLRLRYGSESVALTIADDGEGDPARLREILRHSASGDADGHRRGLANMAARAAELGGRFAIRRSRLGGVEVAVVVQVSDSEVS